MTENTLLFLMQPDGYPAISDDFINGYRNYAIQDILFDKYIDREKLLVISTPISSARYKEIKQLMEKAGYCWLEVSEDTNFSQLKHLLEKQYSFNLDPAHTNIIYGGTNTSREVLHSEELSLGKFLGRNFYCQLYLPLCADVVMPGVCQIDREMKAYSQLFSFVKNNNYFNNIDVLTRFADLKLPWKKT
jgi:hypothetical protein